MSVMPTSSNNGNSTIMTKVPSPGALLRDCCSASEKDEDDLVSNCSETVEREIPRVLSILTSVLERLIARNDRYLPSDSQTNKHAHKLTIFHGSRSPSISIGKYLERLFKYTSCSPSCFVLGYAYIDRLVHKQPDVPVTSLNVHRLLITSVMLATKILDDEHFNNAFYAKVGGVRTSELNRLELELLFRLDFKLFVKMHEFESYCTHLEREALISNRKIERIMPVVDITSETPSKSSQQSPVHRTQVKFAFKKPLPSTGETWTAIQEANISGH